MPHKKKTTTPPAPEQTAEPKPWSEPDQQAEAEEDTYRTEDYLTVTRPFNEEQQQAFLKQLYDLQHDHGHMKGEMEYHKDLAKNAQKRIDSINDQIHGLLKTLEAGNEEADVLCDKVIDYTTGLVSWFVKDTGEFVSKRALTKAERQRGFDYDDPEDVADRDEGSDPAESEPENTPEEESHDQSDTA